MDYKDDITHYVDMFSALIRMITRDAQLMFLNPPNLDNIKYWLYNE